MPSCDFPESKLFLHSQNVFFPAENCSRTFVHLSKFVTSLQIPGYALILFAAFRHIMKQSFRKRGKSAKLFIKWNKYLHLQFVGTFLNKQDYFFGLPLETLMKKKLAELWKNSCVRFRLQSMHIFDRALVSITLCPSISHDEAYRRRFPSRRSWVEDGKLRICASITVWRDGIMSL